MESLLIARVPMYSDRAVRPCFGETAIGPVLVLVCEAKLHKIRSAIH